MQDSSARQRHTSCMETSSAVQPWVGVKWTMESIRSPGKVVIIHQQRAADPSAAAALAGKHVLGAACIGEAENPQSACMQPIRYQMQAASPLRK